jgi:hypothetical protein
LKPWVHINVIDHLWWKDVAAIAPLKGSKLSAGEPDSPEVRKVAGDYAANGVSEQEGS